MLPPADLCQNIQLPTIATQIAEAAPDFDVTVPREALSRTPVTTLPYAAREGVEINGLTESRLYLDHHIKFRNVVNQSTGHGCIAIEKVTVTLRARPKVYIANELTRDACRYREIYIHEQEHIGTDRALMERYRARIADGMRISLAHPAEYASVTVAARYLPIAQRQLEDSVRATLRVLYDEMLRERDHDQRLVDTPEEYERISAACDEPKAQ